VPYESEPMKQYRDHINSSWENLGVHERLIGYFDQIWILLWQPETNQIWKDPALQGVCTNTAAKAPAQESRKMSAISFPINALHKKPICLTLFVWRGASSYVVYIHISYRYILSVYLHICCYMFLYHIYIYIHSNIRMP